MTTALGARRDTTNRFENPGRGTAAGTSLLILCFVVGRRA